MYVPSGVPFEGVIVHGLSEGAAPYGGVSILLTDALYKIDVHPRETLHAIPKSGRAGIVALQERDVVSDLRLDVRLTLRIRHGSDATTQSRSE